MHDVDMMGKWIVRRRGYGVGVECLQAEDVCRRLWIKQGLMEELIREDAW